MNYGDAIRNPRQFVGNILDTARAGDCGGPLVRAAYAAVAIDFAREVDPDGATDDTPQARAFERVHGVTPSAFLLALWALAHGFAEIDELPEYRGER